MTKVDVCALKSPSWHPVASSSDIVARHVFQGQLHGRELAVWRADDGYLNVWENRCLHRGVRLSIGINDGRELTCQYHGWRYATRSAACTYIPAHPADAPARTIHNRVYPAMERYGLVWTTLDEDHPNDIPELAAAPDELLPLRPVVVTAPAAVVIDQLRGLSDEGLALPRESGGLAVSSNHLTCYVQPAAESRCVIRGLLHARAAGEARLGLLRDHYRGLARIRRRIEAEFADLSQSSDEQPVFDPVPEDLPALPPRPRVGSVSLRVRVDRKWRAATGIAGFALAPLHGVLPTAQPGSHIDVHLPSGDVRQYSVVNAPGEGDRYIIGVKREPRSRGGSVCLHDAVREGDVLAISEPRNNFPLRRDATRTILVAGGIGVTPLLAMAQALEQHGLAYRLHYFSQSSDQLAFPDRLATLGDAFRPHCGLDPPLTRAELHEILGSYRPSWQLYVCGPEPMIKMTREVAAEYGWPVDTVHFEYFKNPHEIDKDSAFEVALARSCLTLRVAAGETILQAIRRAGVDVPSSCEQGACGTCVANVIEGEPVHQDVYLNDAEKARGNRIITCVSRCASQRLVLDL